MPANRTRAAPRPRSTRIAPYERIADIEAPPRNAPRLTISKQTTSARVAPRATISVPATTSTPRKRLRVTTPVSQTRSDDPANYCTTQEAVTLLRLAIMWAASRKISLPVFNADLAASFERHTGRKTRPHEVMHILRNIEHRWYEESDFRDSSSELAHEVKIWISTIRDVEEAEQTKEANERTKVHAERMRNLAEEVGNAELLARSRVLERSLSDVQPGDCSMDYPRGVKRARGPSDDEAEVNGMDFISAEDGGTAEPKEATLQLRTSDDASGGEDEDGEHYSSDDDSYDSDDLEEFEGQCDLLLMVAAVVVMDSL